MLIIGSGFLLALAFTSRMVSARYLPLRSGQVTQYLSVSTGTFSGSRVISSCMGCSLGLDFFSTAHMRGNVHEAVLEQHFRQQEAVGVILHRHVLHVAGLHIGRQLGDDLHRIVAHGDVVAEIHQRAEIGAGIFLQHFDFFVHHPVLVVFHRQRNADLVGNGFVNYDRSAKEFGYNSFLPGMSVADVNGADFVGFDAAPCRTLAPGAAWSADTFISHWDRRPIENARLCWRVTSMDAMGESHFVDEGQRDV